MSDHYVCPLCGSGALTADPWQGSYTVTCWLCREVIEPGDWLRAVAEAVGAPGGGDIKLDPARWLKAARENGKVGTAGRCGAWGTGTDSAYFQGCASRLFGPDSMARESIAWLRERGISRRVISEFGLGYNGYGITLPYVSDGRVTAAKLRYPDNLHKTLPGWSGCRDGWTLYGLLPEDKRVVLCAGELDALRCRSVGVPAASVPLGCGTWREAWTERLVCRSVWVCFDKGEERFARRLVDRLRLDGIEAHHAPLPGGMKRGQDLSDYLRDHSRAELEHRLGWNS